MATKTFISDQVLYRLAGGYYDKSFPVQPEDVWAALGDKVNATFKIEAFNVDMANGETVPNGSCLAYYEGVAVVSNNNGTSKSTLPVMPLSLPRNMGVFEITDTQNRASFIPTIAGQRILLKSQPLINDLMGQVGYDGRGKTITYSKDLYLLGITSVNMTLAVLDMNIYTETDTLPIPADMLDGIIDQLVAKFSGVSPETGEVNNFSNANQKLGK